MRIAIAAVLLLAGCATTAKYEAMLNTWLGAPEVELARSWGAPIGSYQAGNSRFLTFASSRNVFLPGQAPQYQTSFVGNTAYTTLVGGRPAQNLQFACTTTFEIVNGRVFGWRYEGNDCVSK